MVIIDSYNLNKNDKRNKFNKIMIKILFHNNAHRNYNYNNNNNHQNHHHHRHCLITLVIQLAKEGYAPTNPVFLGVFTGQLHCNDEVCGVASRG